MKQIRRRIILVSLAVISISVGVILGLLFYKYVLADKAVSYLTEKKRTESVPSRVGWLSIQDKININNDLSENEDLEKSENAEMTTGEEITEATSEELVIEDPAEVLSGAVYNEGMKKAVEDFYNEYATKFPDAEDDLVRYSLFDIDKDGIPELIMNDVPGNCAYLCFYYNGEIGDKIKIFDNHDNEKEAVQGYGAYASLYDSSDVFVVYEFSNDYAESGYGGLTQVLIPEHDYSKTITSSFCRLNKNEGIAETIATVRTVIKYAEGQYSYSFENGEGDGISEEEYRNTFSENIGEDNYRKFFIDELMMADSAFDFRTEFLWNNTPSGAHRDKEGIILEFDNLYQKNGQTE